MFASRSPTGAERRQHERKVLRGSAQLQIAGRPMLAVRMLDLSAGGVGIVSPINLPVKTGCTLRFPLHLQSRGTTTVVEIPSAVTNSIFSGAEDGFKLGLMFKGISVEAAELITQFLRA
jgi:c-di-GMP-binding flagellar brake protein YcgR